MRIDDLALKLFYLGGYGVNTDQSSFPLELMLSSEIWEGVRSLRKYTDRGSEQMMRKYPDYIGSTGYEHVLAVAYIIDRIYVTDLTTGSWTEANTQVSIRISHETSPRGPEFVSQKRFLNNTLVDTLNYPIDKLRDGKLAYGVVAGIHTHPRHHLGEGKYAYGFYSPQDLRTLLSAELCFLGLVTDSFYLLGKTSSSRFPDAASWTEIAQKVNKNEVIHEPYTDILKSHGFVLYYARNFGNTLQRLI